MPENQFIAASVQQSQDLLNMHLADFSDADFLTRPVAGANHAAWQLLQLTNLDVTCANLLDPSAKLVFPEHLKANKETAASDDPTQFLKKDEILALRKSAVDVQVKALHAATPETLAAPSPKGFENFAPTLGHLVALTPVHAAMHLGQIQVIRRKLGKPVIF